MWRWTGSREELYHYGVLGMKWGVRKDRYKSNFDKDTVYKKGSKMHVMTTGEHGVDLHRKYTYASTNATDTAFYNSFLARGTKAATGDKKAFTNELTVTKNIKVPSQKVAVDTFMEMYKNDPIGTADAIAKSASVKRRIGKVSALQEWSLKRTENKLYKQTFAELTKHGEDYVRNEGYNIFSLSMATIQNPARDKYFDMLLSKGYGGILDVNDINNGYTDEPLIVFNPSKSLSNTSSTELTESAINEAEAYYEYKRGKNYRQEWLM